MEYQKLAFNIKNKTSRNTEIFVIDASGHSPKKIAVYKKMRAINVAHFYLCI